jgi:hypothetical protein
MSTSRCILLHHAHIGDEHIIPSFVNSICLVLRNYEHVVLPTPRSCPHSRSTHLSLRRFVLLSTTRFMSTPHCILIHRAHIGDQHIPSFIDLIRLVLLEDEHVKLHTPRSCPQWISTHPFLRHFVSLRSTRSCHIAYSSIMPTLEINTSLP